MCPIEYHQHICFNVMAPLRNWWFVSTEWKIPKKVAGGTLWCYIGNSTCPKNSEKWGIQFGSLTVRKLKPQISSTPAAQNLY